MYFASIIKMSNQAARSDREIPADRAFNQVPDSPRDAQGLMLIFYYFNTGEHWCWCWWWSRTFASGRWVFNSSGGEMAPWLLQQKVSSDKAGRLRWFLWTRPLKGQQLWQQPWCCVVRRGFDTFFGQLQHSTNYRTRWGTYFAALASLHIVHNFVHFAYYARFAIKRKWKKYIYIFIVQEKVHVRTQEWGARCLDMTFG